MGPGLVEITDGRLKTRPSPHEFQQSCCFCPCSPGTAKAGVTHGDRPGVSRWCRGAEVSGGNAHEENMQLPLGRFTSVTFSILQSRRENGVGGRLKIALLKGFLLKWVPTL